MYSSQTFPLKISVDLRHKRWKRTCLSEVKLNKIFLWELESIQWFRHESNPRLQRETQSPRGRRRRYEGRDALNNHCYRLFVDLSIFLSFLFSALLQFQLHHFIILISLSLSSLLLLTIVIMILESIELQYHPYCCYSCSFAMIPIIIKILFPPLPGIASTATNLRMCVLPTGSKALDCTWGETKVPKIEIHAKHSGSFPLITAAPLRSPS